MGRQGICGQACAKAAIGGQSCKDCLGMVVAVPPVERCIRQFLPGADLMKSLPRQSSGNNAVLAGSMLQEAVMSISGLGSLLGSDSTDAIYKVGLGSNTIRTSSSSSDSGDTVDISEEAKRLFSEKVHMYDKGSSTATTQTTSESSDDTSSETAEGESGGESSSSTGGSGGAGGAGGTNDSSSSTVEKIKKQIEALKSQLSSVASHAGSGNSTAVESKIQSLESQIAALEAQLSEAESTSA